MEEKHRTRYTCLGKKQEDGTRKHCGFDMTPAIEDAPADGKEHAATCSWCGTQTKFVTVPVSDLKK